MDEKKLKQLPISVPVFQEAGNIKNDE